MSASPDYDTGPLNWVRGDIDAALQAALGRIHAFSLDAELTNALRLAHDDAHQVTGALRMVGLEGAATVAAAIESCLADINENRLPANDEMLRALRNGLEGLQRWVKDLADGRGSGELALFPLYKRLRELQGAERVFEGELFFPDLRTRVQGKAASEGLSQEALAAKVKAARGQFQLGLLAFLRNVDAQKGLTRMRDALAAIEQVAPSQASHTFWWACVGFVDSLIAHGVEADFHVKQLLARVDLQMRRLMEGSPQVTERLLRDALFFVAKSQSIDGCAADVRSTFGLDRYLPGRGLLDPETMARMRPVLEALEGGLKAAHDSWHAYVEGNAEQLAQFQSLLDRMQPQARILRDSGLSPLLQDLSAAASAAAQRDGEAREQMNLEVASTLLFMQNAVEHEDVLHADYAERAASQQARLSALIEGREVPAIEVESSAQREAERDMLVQMAQEVGQNLRQMETALDAFFRDAGEREALATLPALAQQAQGALTMLELSDAASLLAAATAAVQPYASEGHPDEATQRRLADAFSSLGLFIESYCAGRADAARILRPVLDEFGVAATGGYEDDDAFDETVESGMPARKAEVKDSYLGWRDQPDEGSKKKYLDALTELNRDAELIDDAVLKQQTRAALDASREVAAPPSSLDATLAELTGLEMPERPEPGSVDSGETELPPIELSELSLDFEDTPASAAPAADIGSLAWAAPAEPMNEISQPAAVSEPEPTAVTEAVAPESAEHAPAAADSLLATIPEGVEPELLEIFLEEVNEVLATMGEAVEACQSNPDDQSSMTVIRRGFHTLKGSGRMVGLNELGETAWHHEQLMNGWLAENKSASSDLLRLVGVSCNVFQDWVNALQANQPVALPVPALLAAVDRVARGQPFEMAPVAEAAPIVEAAMPAMEAVAEMAVESVAEFEAETFEFTPVAEVEPETQEATGFEIEFQPVAGIEGEPEDALAETFEFTPVVEAEQDTQEATGFEIEFQPVAGFKGEPEESIAETFEFTPVAEAEPATEEEGGFEIEFQPVAGIEGEPEEALAETFEFTPVVEAEPETEEATEFEIEFQPVAGIEGEPEDALAETFEFTPVAEAEPETEVSGFPAELPPVLAESGFGVANELSESAEAPEPPAEILEAEPEAASVVEGVVEAVKEPEEEIVFSEAAVSEGVHIGPVCLSYGLYEIFMDEVHQRLAVLREEVDRQAGVGKCVISEQARRAVHTLAGIAGTAGITALAELSHALEQYWDRFVHRPFPEAHLPLVLDTVERLQIMVATIEAEYLPEPATDLIAALGELEDEQILETSSWLQDDVPAEIAPPAPEEQDQAGEAVPQSQDVHEEAEAVTPDLGAAEETGNVIEAAQAAVSAGPLDITGMVQEFKAVAPAPVFERREVADEIDEQLLPIFLEEAETLVPDTSAQLRAWKDAPGATAARDALSRNLHTIKGSARMVGAMRLGELTHVMESRVVAVAEGHLAASGEVFQALEAQLDRLADAVERLRQGDLSPVVDEVEVPLAEPIEPVLAPGASGPAVEAPSKAESPAESPAVAQPASRDSNSLTLRVRADWVDRMVNQAGEVAIARSRIESEMFAFKRHVNELTEALVRLRSHIREVEIQAESQMQANFQTQGVAEQFDPLEFDRFTRFQEVTRFLAESVNDISTVQHILLARLGEADAALIQQTRLNRELQQNLLRVRMVPLYSVAERLYRTVRQTARDVDKRAQLDIQGGDLEIDRSVLEKVTAPLEHLLRNALAHGIETPAERSAAGKPEFGEIVLSARQTGNEMLLTVKDDGAGLNFARIREKALANGLLQPGAEPADSLLAQMIFAAGFSTADAVSQVAGRGVGMDVVKSEISALGGRIEIESTRGAGSSFNIYLPLTLAMTQAVMVHAAKHDYALPTPLVQQVLELKPEDLAQAMAAGEVTWRGTRYPLSYLPHLLGDTEAVHEVQRYNQVVLLQSGSSRAAVLVDVIEGTREVVVKNIGPQMARITGVAGATVRGDGRVILILNPVPLAMRWASQPRSVAEQAAPAETVEVSAALQPPMVLVVDDSLTVRKITTRLLTREGFRVDSAKDGVDALEKMNDLLPDVVLLDVEMPRMDGFELARVMHNDARLQSVPIIMITSRTADKHREHAMELGVKVYMGKPYQEEQLLETIAEQLGHAISPAL